MDNREVQELIDRVARLSRELREATKRLTDIKDILGDNYDLDRIREAVTRQKEYEQFMERWQEAVKIAGAVKDIGAERIAELVQADREGRCMVLPCKLGEKVWCLYRECFTNDRSIVVGESTFSYGMIHDFGKTVFLTREEAEKSLKEMEK